MAVKVAGSSTSTASTAFVGTSSSGSAVAISAVLPVWDRLALVAGSAGIAVTESCGELDIVFKDWGALRSKKALTSIIASVSASATTSRISGGWGLVGWCLTRSIALGSSGWGLVNDLHWWLRFLVRVLIVVVAYV